MVSERNANRVVRQLSGGKAFQIGGEVVEPLGLLQGDPFISVIGFKPNEPAPLRLSDRDWDSVYVVSHATSKVYRLDKTEWKLVYEAPIEENNERHLGFGYLAGAGGTMFLSDEMGGDVWMMSSVGHAAKFDNDGSRKLLRCTGIRKTRQ